MSESQPRSDKAILNPHHFAEETLAALDAENANESKAMIVRDSLLDLSPEEVEEQLTVAREKSMTARRAIANEDSVSRMRAQELHSTAKKQLEQNTAKREALARQMSGREEGGADVLGGELDAITEQQAELEFEKQKLEKTLASADQHIREIGSGSDLGAMSESPKKEHSYLAQVEEEARKLQNAETKTIPDDLREVAESRRHQIDIEINNLTDRIEAFRGDFTRLNRVLGVTNFGQASSDEQTLVAQRNELIDEKEKQERSMQKPEDRVPPARNAEGRTAIQESYRKEIDRRDSMRAKETHGQQKQSAPEISEDAPLNSPHVTQDKTESPRTEPAQPPHTESEQPNVATRASAKTTEGSRGVNTTITEIKEEKTGPTAENAEVQGDARTSATTENENSEKEQEKYYDEIIDALSAFAPKDTDTMYRALADDLEGYLGRKGVAPEAADDILKLWFTIQGIVDDKKNFDSKDRVGARVKKIVAFMQEKPENAEKIFSALQ